MSDIEELIKLEPYKSCYEYGVLKGSAEAIEEYRRTLSDICCRDNYSSAYLLNLFKRIAKQLKEQK